MTIVIALGGNALLQRGERPDVATQERNIVAAARELAALAVDHSLVVTHGNGPQIGLLALQAESCRDAPPYPLDVLGAESEGQIGYLLETALRNELPNRDIATLLTQIVVDPVDPAFGAPTKPIGPVYGAERARRLAQARGWHVAPDGDGFRRIVASPRPQRIIEIETIRLLVAHDILVVCAGGGGIPVVETDTGWHGVEAVIDKDLSAALLARDLGADALLMLTDVNAVYADWDGARARPLSAVTTVIIRNYTFAPGTMGPKVEAAIGFAEATGRMAGIGRLQDAAAILRGAAGTRVTRSPASKS
ncbi:MAG: carbamate kinase [Rhodospirillales bacterium]|nr:MAG: carbamate kinase [Rhodospirillales bacterium]